MYATVLALWLSSATYAPQVSAHSPIPSVTVTTAYDVTCDTDSDCAEKFGGEY